MTIKSLLLTGSLLVAFAFSISVSLAAPKETGMPTNQAAFESAPRDYALLSRNVDGREAPTMVLRVDSVIYPVQTTYQQFLTAGAPRTPEQLCARYTDLLLAPRADETAYLALFSPERQKKDEDRKRLLKNYVALRRYAPQIGAPVWRRRYDFGNSSLLDVKYPKITKSNVKDLFWALFSLKATGSLVERTTDRAYFGDTNWSSVPFQLVNLVYDGNGPVSTEQKLPYSFVVGGETNEAVSEPTPANSHRVTVLFDGTVLDVPLDGTTQKPDAAVNFVQHAAQVHRADKTAAILRLWNKKSAKKIRHALDENSTQLNYETTKALLSDASLRVVFAINSDKGALVFLRRPNPSKDQSAIECISVFKEGGTYKLSFDSDIPVLNTTNLDELLQSSAFQRYLLKITAPPAA